MKIFKKLALSLPPSLLVSGHLLFAESKIEAQQAITPYKIHLSLLIVIRTAVQLGFSLPIFLAARPALSSYFASTLR